MNREAIIRKTAEYVRKQLEGEGSGHDWFHIQRVWAMSKRLARSEDADLFIVELAALLHDIADHKFHGGDDTVGPKVAREWLEGLGVNPEDTDHIAGIIKDLSFKGAQVETPMRSIEGQIVQDADRLDAIGAIGIARAFAYGGHKGRELHNPEKPPASHDSFEAYKKDNGPTINHFYEKLFLLKNRMNTKAAKKIAEERHKFMEEYVARFLREWEGTDHQN